MASYINLIIHMITKEDMIDKLLPNIWIFIAHIIATIVLLLLLSFFAYKPFKTALKQRQKKIRGLIDDAVQKQTRAVNDENDAAQLLKQTKLTADNIINKAKLKAFDDCKNIINKAKKEAEIINNQAIKDTIRVEAEAEDNIRQKIIDLAFVAAEQILEKTIDKNKNQDLINNFIKDLDK